MVLWHPKNLVWLLIVIVIVLFFFVKQVIETPCPQCNGEGVLDVESFAKCHKCDGGGKIGNGLRKCPDCKGEGGFTVKGKRTCRKCGGSGKRF